MSSVLPFMIFLASKVTLKSLINEYFHRRATPAGPKKGSGDL